MVTVTGIGRLTGAAGKIGSLLPTQQDSVGAIEKAKNIKIA
jgi:hypothetical protein